MIGLAHESSGWGAAVFYPLSRAEQLEVRGGKGNTPRIKQPATDE